VGTNGGLFAALQSEFTAQRFELKKEFVAGVMDYWSAGVMYKFS